MKNIGARKVFVGVIKLFLRVIAQRFKNSKRILKVCGVFKILLRKLTEKPMAYLVKLGSYERQPYPQ
jgi:hypothetical protein